MKIILSENSLENLILKYLDEKFPDLNYTEYHDEDGNPSDCACVFYNGHYSDGETFFRYYKKCWWNRESSDNAETMYRLSPMIIFEYSKDYDMLNAYFGSSWKSVFSKWFFKKTGFEVKSITN